MAESQFTPEELATEEWRDVLGYEGHYQVSNLGRVKNIGNYHKSWMGRLKRTPHQTGSGYRQVTLYKHDQGRTFLLHIVVARAFLGPCPDGYEINHRDAIKHNNRIANLEYVTRLQNIHHAIAKGRFVYRPKNVPRNTKSGKLPIL